MWLNELTVALVEKNTDKIGELLDTLPEFETLEEMQKAQALIKECLILLHTLKDETAATMNKLKKSRDFLNSTKYNSNGSLDITS